MITFKVSVGALLQADRQVSDSQMGRSARQTAVLSGPGTRLARLVARPTDAALVREATGRTAADASAENVRLGFNFDCFETINIPKAAQ